MSGYHPWVALFEVCKSEEKDRSLSVAEALGLSVSISKRLMGLGGGAASGQRLMWGVASGSQALQAAELSSSGISEIRVSRSGAFLIIALFPWDCIQVV